MTLPHSNPSRTEIDLLCLRAAPLASYNIMLEDPRGSRAQQSPEKVRSPSPAHGGEPQCLNHPQATDHCTPHTCLSTCFVVVSYGSTAPGLQGRRRYTNIRRATGGTTPLCGLWWCGNPPTSPVFFNTMFCVASALHPPPCHRPAQRVVAGLQSRSPIVIPLSPPRPRAAGRGFASEPWRRAVEAASSLASSPRRAHVEAVASS